MALLASWNLVIFFIFTWVLELGVRLLPLNTYHTGKVEWNPLKTPSKYSTNQAFGFSNLIRFLDYSSHWSSEIYLGLRMFIELCTEGNVAKSFFCYITLWWGLCFCRSSFACSCITDAILCVCLWNMSVHSHRMLPALHWIFFFKFIIQNKCSNTNWRVELISDCSVLPWDM